MNERFARNLEDVTTAHGANGDCRHTLHDNRLTERFKLRLPKTFLLVIRTVAQDLEFLSEVEPSSLVIGLGHHDLKDRQHLTSGVDAREYLACNLHWIIFNSNAGKIVSG